MSDTFWLPVRFKGQQIFAECDAGGELSLQGGRVSIVYKLGASKAYSTFPDRLERIAGATAQAGAAAAAAPGRSGGAAKKKKGKKDDEILGGTQADLDNPDHIHLWSDGACSGNPGPAGAGTVVLVDGTTREMSTWLGQGTNNIAELVGIQQGVRQLEQPVERTVVVHTDSQYCIGVLGRKWKAKANQALIAEIRQELAPLPRIVWHWVRGHVGVELNERCDELARRGISDRESRNEVV
jgi:ribonuclease HI